MTPDLDLLTSNSTSIFQLELTTNCNLRCVYCAVSLPEYKGQDLAVDDIGQLAEMMRARNVQLVQINGHGETTSMPNWQMVVHELLKNGFPLALISNFARHFSDEELETLACLSQIQISVDTHRPQLLRKIRRRVDLGTILVNLAGVRMKASALGRPSPRFSWSCVLTDIVAPDFVDYVRFGLACGVHDFFVCNLTEYDDLIASGTVGHVTKMDIRQLAELSANLDKAKELVAQAGGCLDIQAGLTDCIREKLEVMQ